MLFLSLEPVFDPQSRVWEAHTIRAWRIVAPQIFITKQFWPVYLYKHDKSSSLVRIKQGLFIFFDANEVLGYTIYH